MNTKHTPERLVLTFGLRNLAHVETEECREARFSIPRKFEELGAHMVDAYNATYAAGMDDPAAEIARLRADMDRYQQTYDNYIKSEADLREALDALLPFAKMHCGDDSCQCHNCKAARIERKHGRGA